MSKNYDIKTKSMYLIGSDCSSAYLDKIGGAVAAGMKRYVTFIQMAPVKSGGSIGSKVYLCSTPASDTANTLTAASAAQKMVVTIESATTANDMSIPGSPNTEHPLFTIASEKFLVAHIATSAGFSSPVNLFVQYYDE